MVSGEEFIANPVGIMAGGGCLSVGGKSRQAGRQASASCEGWCDVVAMWPSSLVLVPGGPACLCWD